MIDLLRIELAHLGTLPDGRQFEWESVGSGEPMLWVEGGPGFPAHLGRPEASLFGGLFKAHLVNAPGCGRTSPPSRPDQYDLAGHVAFFEAVRVALGLGPLTVVGHSWGGLVATAYAALEPASVRRLIVLDGYAGGGSVAEADAAAERERSFERVRDRAWFADAFDALEASAGLRGQMEQEDVDTFAPAWPLYFADPELPANRAHVERLSRELRQNLDVQRAWTDRYEAEDHRDLARTVVCPALIVAGEHDFICGPVWNRVLDDAIPNARFVEIADAGHFPQYEQVDALMALVRSWLAE